MAYLVLASGGHVDFAVLAFHGLGLFGEQRPHADDDFETALGLESHGAFGDLAVAFGHVVR